MTAAEHYAAQVDAVWGQRARLRGAEPSGDLFGDLEPDHALLKVDPRRPLDSTPPQCSSHRNRQRFARMAAMP